MNQIILAKMEENAEINQEDIRVPVRMVTKDKTVNKVHIAYRNILKSLKHILVHVSSVL